MNNILKVSNSNFKFYPFCIFAIFTLFFTNNVSADTFYPDPPVWSVFDANPPRVLSAITDKNATCEAAGRFWLTTGLLPAMKATYDSIADCKFNYPTRGGAASLTLTIFYHANSVTGVPEGFQRSVFLGAAVNVGYCPAGSSKDINGNLPCICYNGSMYNARTRNCQVTALPDFLTPPLVDKNPPNSCHSTLFPIKYTTGNKTLAEQDYRFNANNASSFIRHYHSKLGGGSQVGINWLATTQPQIAAGFSVSYSGLGAVVVRPNGLKLPFRYNGSVWLTDVDVTDKLTELKNANVRTGWTYLVDATGEMEVYNLLGQLMSITDSAGYKQTMTYSDASTPISIAPAPGLLIGTADPLGRSLYFAYDTSSRISKMTNPAGGIYTYTYSADSNNNLTSVSYPDGSTKTYHYENATFPNALTGVIDENGYRYMTYTYDANGRAIDEISPTFGTNVNHYALSYNPSVSTTVTDPLGSVRTYNFTTILGVVKSTGQSQPGGSGCSAAASALTYDVNGNGNVASRTDFKGNKTTYVYDMARNLETSRTEGLTSTGATTAATRTITTSWHPTWHLPLVTSEYTGTTVSSTPLRSTNNVYDSHGNITSITEADPMHSLSRTTTITYTYSTVVTGLVLTKVIDGPRTDVNDVTTYTYYPHDAVCTPSAAAPIVDLITGTSPVNLGCRGQQLSVTNALNQTTTYDRYNHHGQVEQMTDANGLITSYSYDLRQRLLSKTVSSPSITTQTTSLTYDGVGQVTRLTLPDNSSLNYSYDAAHRLTDVQDSLGNKVHYTLDTEGNRINETTTDPLGTLTKTLTRSYDALNRLQQVIGVQ